MVADNHQRFLGGVWTGVGLALCVAQANVWRHRGIVNTSFGLVFLGGLARFSQMNPEITFGSAVIGSLVVELVGMPALFFWTARVVGSTADPARRPLAR